MKHLIVQIDNSFGNRVEAYTLTQLPDKIVISCSLMMKSGIMSIEQILNEEQTERFAQDLINHIRNK